MTPVPFPDHVDAVLLDVGGVLHLPDPARVAGAAERAEVDIDFSPAATDRAHYAGSAALDRHNFHDGDASIWGHYLHAYGRALDLDGDELERFLDHLASEFTTIAIWSRVVPGAHDALRGLAATGRPIGIVTNNDGTAAARLFAEELCQVGPGPGVQLHALVDSGLVGVSKPDPAIFRIALGALGLEPDCVVYVGDTPAADVDGALAAGIHPILIDPYDFVTAVIDATHVRHLADVAELIDS